MVKNNSNISGFLIIVPILTFIIGTRTVFTLIHFIYTKTKKVKKKKKTALGRLKINTIFLIHIHHFQVNNFLIN